MRPRVVEEEEEEEDLSAEVGMSYREVLVGAKPVVSKPAVVVPKPVVPKPVLKAQVLSAKPIATTTTTTTKPPPPTESIKQTLATAGEAVAWKRALQQALGEEEEGRVQSCLLALVANTTFSPVSLAKDYAALQQLLGEYEQEAGEWELARSSLVQLPPRLTVSEELEVEQEEEDLALLQEMQALSTLPAACLAALESTELRCRKIQQQMESCEADSRLLAKAFAHTAFEEDARQPKKMLKLLLGEDGEFNF